MAIGYQRANVTMWAKHGDLRSHSQCKAVEEYLRLL